MSRKRVLVAGLLAAGLVGLAVIAAQVPAQAKPAPVDPSSLGRGADPAVARLVHDTIRDGDLTVPATRRQHRQLWTTADGYLLLDGPGRLTHVSDTGDKQLVARHVYTVAVSADGRRIAWGAYDGPDLGPPVRLTVSDPDGRPVLARRTFAHVLWAQAVTRGRVLLATSWAAPDPTTQWWHLRRDRMSTLVDRAALGADVPHDRLVLSVGDPDRFCNRVAPLSHPRRTLWRSCDVIPRQWSPDGRHAIVTRTYFDDTGTDFWKVVDGTTGHLVSGVHGRLDWNAVWEDDQHFLTSAMGEDGRAAVIRCDLDRHCERASRLWNTGWDGWPPFYQPPPVLLSRN